MACIPATSLTGEHLYRILHLFNRNIVYVYTHMLTLYTSIHILTFTNNDFTFYLYIWF